MDKEKLLKYELPSVAEYVSVGWVQEIIAWYTARRINFKVARYNKRIKREVFIKLTK